MYQVTAGALDWIDPPRYRDQAPPAYCVDAAEIVPAVFAPLIGGR